MKRRFAGAVVVLSGVLTLNCDSSTPAQPSPPPPQPPPSPAPAPIAARIEAFVSDVAWRSVEGASVEILNGSETLGTFVSDSNGRVTYSGMLAGSLTFRARKDGYAPAMIVERVQPVMTPFIYLETLNSARIELGAYRLTFRAQEACTGLPEDFRTRTYAATVTAGNQYGAGPDRYRVSIPGTTHWISDFLTGEFTLGVAGDHVAITEDTFPEFVERLPPFQRLEFGVFGSLVADTPAVSTLSFAGFLAYCDLKSEPSGTFCQSVNKALLNNLVLCHGQFVLNR